MPLIIVLVILAGWGIIIAAEKLQPKAPIVKDWDKLLKDANAKGAKGKEISKMVRSGKY